MKLIFHENKFVLQSANNLELSGRWRHCLERGQDVCTYETSKISEAVRFRKWADERTEKIFSTRMLTSSPMPTGGPLSPPHKTLFKFQRERGVPHILTGNKTYLAHQPGLGKTAQAICAVNTKPGRTLIICPSFLKITWAREILEWFIKDFPTVAIVLDSKSAHKVNWDADFVICSDAMIEKEWVRTHFEKRNFRFIFVDEAHRFKTPDASRTIALFGGRNKKIRCRGLIYRSEHVSLLSGTPLLNRPIELWPVLYAMAPELIDFMPYQDFGFQYGGAIQDERGHWRFVGSANEADLNKRIMGRFMQRITKAEVLPDLPKKIREVILIDKDSRAHDVKALDHTLLKGLRATTRISEADSLGDIAKVRHANGVAKVSWVADFVSSILFNDLTERVILFAHHRDVVAKLAESLRALQPMVINGGVPEDMRVKYQDLFQSGRRRLLIGNIDSMNLGVTLTKATRVMFSEYAWTPALNEQAEDRAHRIGLKDSIFCQYFVLPNSIDEVILNRVLEKETNIERVMKNECTT